MANNAIGIDLGTTFCSVGTVRAATIELIAFANGDRGLPSHVYFDPNGPEIVVGDAAKFAVRTVGHAVFDSKRFIGSKFTDPAIQEDIKHWPFTVVNCGGEPKVEMQYNGSKRLFSAGEISTYILKEIKKTADAFIGKPMDTPTRAVITVPAYFNNSQRECTKKAAEAANLSVISILNEPTAAAIAYAHQRLSSGKGTCEKRTILIYDFGGGTFDVSVIELNEKTKTVVVKATDGDPHLGGEDIDSGLINYFTQKFHEAAGSNKTIPTARNIALHKVCEKTKCLLSSTNEVYVDSEFLDDAGVDCNLTRAQFDDIMNLLFLKTIRIVKEVLDKNRIPLSVIDDIVCVGGSSRIPKVQELLKQNFPRTNLCQDINANEVVAYGSTIVANFEGFDFTVVDVLNHTLSTDIEGGKVYPMIKKNTALPAVHTELFGNAVDNQTHIDVNVYEGEGETTDSNALLGSFSIDGITPSPARSVRIEVTFAVDTNGILTVTGKETVKGKTTTITISVT